MPKSKCNKIVSLSKTKKKGRERKESIINVIREATESYDSIYVLSFENMRNLKFKEFREQPKLNSRFFLGSNKVMQVALGQSASDEIRPGLCKVSKLLRGDSGLFLINMPRDEVESLFNKFKETNFARTGSIAAEKGTSLVHGKKQDCIKVLGITSHGSAKLTKPSCSKMHQLWTLAGV
ncbi:hypothetical protein REPUB_Repub08aG0054900 [Reevesia pubescens]